MGGYTMSGVRSIDWSEVPGTFSWSSGAPVMSHGRGSAYELSVSRLRFADVLEETGRGGDHTEYAPFGVKEELSGSAEEDRQLRWAAEQLEAFFVQQLLTSMRSTVPEGGLFERSFATRTYEEMLEAERAQALAQGRGIGLSEAIFGALRG